MQTWRVPTRHRRVASVERREGQRAMQTVFALAMLPFIAGRVCTADNRGTTEPTTIEEFRVRAGGRLVLLPVTIGEKTYPFVLDTGCNMLVFDQALRPLLGRRTAEIMSTVAGGQARLELFDAPDCRLGRALLPRTSAACTDLRGSMVPMGEDVYGVIGFNCLINRVFRIDFDHGTVTFLTRPDNDAGHRIPLEWFPNGEMLDGPYLSAEVAGAGSVRFLLDTGSCGFRSGAISKSLFDGLLKSRDAERVGPPAVGVIGLVGSIPARIARIEQLSIGPFSHPGLLFDDRSPRKLGLGYLSRYIVTFDLPKKAVYLRPGRQFSRPDRYDLSGLELLPVDEKKIVVGEVDSGSAAEKAGLRLWDEVVLQR